MNNVFENLKENKSLVQMNNNILNNSIKNLDKGDLPSRLFSFKNKNANNILSTSQDKHVF